jgi:hypothetical protein
MNLITNLIKPRNADATLKVLIVTRNDLSGGFGCGSATRYAILDKLELVYYGERKLACCNTHPSNTDPNTSLATMKQRIANNEFDLIATRDVRQISDWLDEVLTFVRLCVLNGTRIISFEDRFDTADPNWEQELFVDFFDASTATAE